MAEAARILGPSFESVDVRVERGRTLRLAGVLRARPELEEVPILRKSPSPRANGEPRTLRAFRVQGHGLHHEGLRDGDCLLVESAGEIRRGLLVLAEIGGHLALGRASTGAESATSVDPSSEGGSPARSSVDPPCRVIGTFVGIIRKRGFGGGEPQGAANESAPTVQTRPVTTASVLRSKLRMLESTCAGTKNPRLQRALRNEAEQVRRQLQIEATFNKLR